ncbi:probable 28S ribosomal protein S23, mitochondrial [Eurytemora carolleeae]|uniref:probable 28S ribosomal protein S23, mitochondrial n=1 Tax=Eurytemora carolleeae TaxID=1294199 RepID=UPI000C7806C7|nr:probable 28S ribosomal protein S23, mitochondrial [Eurytemora carolleeae]|eukprot:XP_023319686.1 probable 28S ribosomal protein S23, mitochondrial [Eurytemora affinis]
MAQSRLEKIGTIFSKIRGFQASGAIQPEQVPLWYNIYEAFPPKYEPRWDRKPTNNPIKKILYKEDVIRAKYYQTFGNKEVVNLQVDGNLASQTFINKYLSLEQEGHPADSLWERTVQALELDKEATIENDELTTPKRPEKISFKDLFNEKDNKI